MTAQSSIDERHGSSSNRTKNDKRRKNMMRLGGEGLSLEAFANAKSKSKDYNPALIKKKREFYRNAKCVNKYRKELKQQAELDDLSSAVKQSEGENKVGDSTWMNNGNKKRNNRSHSLRELYEKKHEEEEKARIEREAIIQKKREEREKVMAKRKAMKEKMLKKTGSGQPVMKYRIQNLLQSIQRSTT